MQGRRYGPAGLMAEHHDQRHAQVTHCILQRSDGGRGTHRAGVAHHEQIPEAGVEQQLHRHPRIGAAEHRRQRMLPLHHRPHAFPRAVGMQGMALQKPLVALLEPLQHRPGPL